MTVTHVIQLITLMVMVHFGASQWKVEEMIKIESKAVSVLENYVISAKENLMNFEKLFEDFKKKHSSFENHMTSNNNPLDTYMITRQLTTELGKLNGLVLNATQEYEQSMEILRKQNEFPQTSAYEKFKQSLILFQKLNLLGAQDLLSEFVSTENATHSSFSAFDYLELAKEAFEEYEQEITEEWINEFEKVCSIQNCDKNLVIEALEYKAYNKYLMGDIKTARDLTERILASNSSHERAKDNLEFFNNEINHVPVEKRTNANLKRPDGYLDVDELQSLACRGIIWPNSIITSQLKCRYVHNNSPFLRLAPIKEEELYPDPRIVSYMDVISDYEIEILKNLSYKSIHRSMTVSGKGKARTSKQAWVEDDEHEVISMLSRRVADITGLEVLNSSESFQVVNYGIGGHYVFHEDYLGQGFLTDEPSPSGDRVATFLFYLNDVKSGGGTVFPLLRVMKKAEKGSAILWYNLDKSGAGDSRTIHAGCPVLEGQKWIANKWILEDQQTFKRPCPLDYKEYEPLPEYKSNPNVFLF